jgi:parvulin-like peptidyl-prolyl isomerase
MLKLVSFVPLAIALAVLPRANAGSSTHATDFDPTAISGNPVVARSKGFEIRQSEMDQVLATARAQNPQDELPPDAEIHVLDQLIEIQLVLQKATDAEKAEGKKKADQRFADILKTLSAAEFERRLKVTHMTADDLRLMLYQEETAQTSLTRQLGIKVTDADAKKWFDEHPEAYDQPEAARVRELLLLTTSDFSRSDAPPLPAAAIQARHKLIFDLHKRVRAGEDFAALARQYNEDPISKATDGELSFRRDQMEFGDLAYSLKANQISDVVTNEEGYRFFQLLEIIPAQKAEFADLADRLKNMLAGRQKRMLAPAYIEQLRKEANVEILDAGLKTKIAAAEAEAAEAAKAQAAFEARQAAEAANRPPVPPAKP